MSFTSLAHHIDLRWLYEAYLLTRKDAAVGVDGQTAEDYAKDLGGNLRSLWIIDLDIRKFFYTLDKNHLREILKRRVRDGVLLRLIGKWLKAGVLEDGGTSYPERGTPQGAVISPILSNIYLHDVLDRWFADVVKPRLKGDAFLIRIADDGAPRAHLNIGCGAIQTMRAGPSKPTYRRRLQTTPKLRWLRAKVVSVGEKARRWTVSGKDQGDERK